MLSFNKGFLVFFSHLGRILLTSAKFNNCNCDEMCRQAVRRRTGEWGGRRNDSADVYEMQMFNGASKRRSSSCLKELGPYFPYAFICIKHELVLFYNPWPFLTIPPPCLLKEMKIERST